MFNIFRLFRRKKEESITLPEKVTDTATIDNVKSKMDLVAAEMDGIRAQLDSLNQRTQAIESMIKEIYDLAKS